jgi:hypothetical protein
MPQGGLAGGGGEESRILRHPTHIIIAGFWVGEKLGNKYFGIMRYKYLYLKMRDFSF